MALFVRWCLPVLFLFTSGCISIDSERSSSYYYIPITFTVLYIPNGNSLELGSRKVDEADFFSFEVLAEDFAKDKTNIYYQEMVVTDIVDYDTFYIDSNGVAKDKANVYIGYSDQLEALTGVDPDSYVELPDWAPSFETVVWAKDKNHYYLSHKKVDVDYKTFMVVCNHLYKDRSYVYTDYKGSIKKTMVDPAEFKRLNEQHCYDDKYIYVADIFETMMKYRYSDFSTVKVFCTNYVGVERKVYFTGKEVVGADYQTFSCVDDFHAKDKMRNYHLQFVSDPEKDI